MKIPTKSLEFMLLGWSDSNKGGFKVTFAVPPEDEDYFRAATAAKGKIAGQRYAAVLVELNDDESAKPLAKPEPKPLAFEVDSVPSKESSKARFPEGLTGLAVRWCNDHHFAAWLDDEYNDNFAKAGETAKTPEEQCKATICLLCGISSRKELNTNPKAAELFRRLILEPYHDKRAEDGVDNDPF